MIDDGIFRLINWMLTDGILTELILILIMSIMKVSKKRFVGIFLGIISVILLIVALSLGIISALSLQENATELALVGGFY